MQFSPVIPVPGYIFIGSDSILGKGIFSSKQPSCRGVEPRAGFASSMDIALLNDQFMLSTVLGYNRKVWIINSGLFTCAVRVFFCTDIQHNTSEVIIPVRNAILILA